MASSAGFRSASTRTLARRTWPSWSSSPSGAERRGGSPTGQRYRARWGRSPHAEGSRMESTVTTILDGVSFGMILFLIAAGLSLVMGVMGILNLAHGALFMLGA